MNALTRSPVRGWDVFGDLDDLVSGFFAPVRNAAPGDSQLLPAMDIVENDNEYVVQADLPGIKKEDISVSVKDGVLIIEAETSRENVEKEGDKVIKLERHCGKHRRSLKLGNAIADSKNIG